MSKKNNTDNSLNEDDPYYEFAKGTKSTMGETKPETSRQRKWRQFKERWGDIKGGMQMSFLMGCMVGGGFGGIVGLYYAISHRSFIIFPVSMITSGLSFGFFLMCGSLVRSNDFTNKSLAGYDNRLLTYNIESGKYQLSENPLWMFKY